ncbi:hypothetical protein, partial [Candidatus Raskinella chloraquaticus]|uniref:hypothetical protein n=1 Tax=Candidatus Raskinella chloraquaticus TaxID=1951219 RepID=UPI00366AAFF2
AALARWRKEDRRKDASSPQTDESWHKKSKQTGDHDKAGKNSKITTHGHGSFFQLFGNPERFTARGRNRRRAGNRNSTA